MGRWPVVARVRGAANSDGTVTEDMSNSLFHGRVVGPSDSETTSRADGGRRFSAS
ncbi:MAG: hypothetical protein MI923_18450 [Phycisphaerales bacterium]|nr:hypothetical protein [Phycisphaerales bacterium]